MSAAPTRRPDARTIPLLLLLFPCVAQAAGVESVAGAIAPSTFALVARALGSLAGVVALIAVLALLFRRLREHGRIPRNPRSLRCVERLDLGGRRELRVVRAGDRTLVLGVTEKRIELLTELDPGDAAHGAEPSPADDAATGTGPPALRVLQKLTSSS